MSSIRDLLSAYAVTRRDLFNHFNATEPSDEEIIKIRLFHYWCVHNGILFMSVNRINKKTLDRKLFSAETTYEHSYRKVIDGVCLVITNKAGVKFWYFLSDEFKESPDDETRKELDKWMA